MVLHIELDTNDCLVLNSKITYYTVLRVCSSESVTNKELA